MRSTHHMTKAGAIPPGYKVCLLPFDWLSD